NSPASGYPRPRLLRGSGIWARRSSRYWLRAAAMGEDDIGGRVLAAGDAAGDGERENFHRSDRAPPAAAETPESSPAATTSQVTALIHDFAVSLALLSGDTAIAAARCPGSIVPGRRAGRSVVPGRSAARGRQGRGGGRMLAPVAAITD